jgi:putative endonuclease
VEEDMPVSKKRKKEGKPVHRSVPAPAKQEPGEAPVVAPAGGPPQQRMGRPLYCGATNDLEARVARHAAGKGARYTRSRLPVEVVLAVRVKDRGAALRRESAVKRLSRAEKLALVAARGARKPPAPRRARRS